MPKNECRTPHSERARALESEGSPHRESGISNVPSPSFTDSPFTHSGRSMSWRSVRKAPRGSVDLGVRVDRFPRAPYVANRLDHVSTSGLLKGLSHPRLGAGRFPPASQPFPRSGCSMRKKTKRLLWVGAVLAILVAIPVVGWLSLTYQPSYYRAM